jgi:hypothetical protein
MGYIGLTMQQGLRLGYGELVGTRLGEREFAFRIRRFRLRTILDVLGRLSALLDDAPHNAPTTQFAICDYFFGAPGTRELWKRAQDYVRRGKYHVDSIALFDDLQLLTLAKAAVLETDDQRVDRGSRQELGELLLISSDFTAAGIPPAQLGRHAEYVEFFGGNFFSGQVLLHSIARAYDLYLSGNPTLRGSRHFLDLPAALERRLGLPVTEVLSFLMWTVAPWLSLDGSNALSIGSTLVDLERHVPRKKFPRRNFDASLRILAADVHDLRKRVRGYYSISRLRPYHVLPFAQTPLIKLGSVIACPSVKLLADRLHRGWHHILLDTMRAEGTADDFLRFMGDVFEDYAHRILKRMNPALGERTYLGPSEIAEAVTAAAKCDGIVKDGESVLVLESKASQYKMDAVAGESLADYEGRFHEVVVERAARQLNATIEAIRSGDFVHAGIASALRFQPLIVLLDLAPMGELRYARVWREIAARGWLAGPDTRPLQIVSIAELEMLELHQELTGDSLVRVIERKLSRAGFSAVSMRDFLGATNSPVRSTAKNPHLLAIFDEIANRLQRFISQRQ